jgi:hypothetical protein
MNKELLKEIKRFRLISSYKPGLTLNEQGENDLTDDNKTKIFGSDTGFEKFSPANKELVEIYMTEDLNKLIMENQNKYMKEIPITLDNSFKLTLNNDVVLTPYDFCGEYEKGVDFMGDASGTRDACLRGVKLYQLKNSTYSTTLMDKDNKPYESEFIGVKTEFVVKNLLDDFIAKYPKYNSFFKQYEEKYLENNMSISKYVKDMINNLSLTVLVVPESQANLEKFGFTIENTSDNKLSDYTKTKKEYKKIVSSMKNENGTSISGNFYDVFKTTDFIVPIKNSTNKSYYYLKNNFAIFKVAKLNLYIPPKFSEGEGGLTGPTPTPTPTPLVAPIELKLDLINAYEFDKVDKGGSSYWRELKSGEEGESGQEQFDDFIVEYNALKSEYSDVWDKYLEFLKNNKVKIYGYASIDRPPTDTIIGRYPGCQSNKNIKDYNQCLSEKRAQQAVKDIVAKIPELDGILEPIGGGQTDQFDGKNYTNATSDETYQNRRIYGVFPTYETTR